MTRPRQEPGCTIGGCGCLFACCALVALAIAMILSSF